MEISYAQIGEDIVLAHALTGAGVDLSKAFWIDVGANDPVYISVTKYFSDRGGTGINIEPQEDLIRKYSTERPIDINIQAGVGAKEGNLRLFGADVGASFIKNSHQSALSGKSVPVLPLSKICREHIVDGQNIHFLKVDVEGFEKEVFQGADFEHYRPWIIMAEAYNSDGPTYPEWEKLLLQTGYIFAYDDKQNRYYVAKEHEDLLPFFSSADEVRNDPQIFRVSEYLTYKRERDIILNSKTWKVAMKLRKLMFWK